MNHGRTRIHIARLVLGCDLECMVPVSEPVQVHGRRTAECRIGAPINAESIHQVCGDSDIVTARPLENHRQAADETAVSGPPRNHGDWRNQIGWYRKGEVGGNGWMRAEGLGMDPVMIGSAGYQPRYDGTVRSHQ